jgi:hypothetical protein
MNAHTEPATVQNLLRERTRPAWLDAVTAALLLSSLALSLVTGDGQWLMRTGSLVVAAALCSERGWWRRPAHRAGVIGTIAWGWGDLIDALL